MTRHDVRSPFDRDLVAAEIRANRRRVSLLGEVRELVFGAQDGLVSTLAVVLAVAAASDSTAAVVVAGLASALAGVFSMAIGEYLGSTSQDEIRRGHLADEWREVHERPHEAEAELIHLFAAEGMTHEDAVATTALIGRYPRSLLTTMAAKELGIVADESGETVGSPLRGAVVMGASFAAGAAVPVAPFLLTRGTLALGLAIGLTGLVLFTLGASKARWTGRSWLRSGAQVVLLAAVAGGAGHLLGTVLPRLLGAAAAG